MRHLHVAAERTAVLGWFYDVDARLVWARCGKAGAEICFESGCLDAGLGSGLDRVVDKTTSFVKFGSDG